MDYDDLRRYVNRVLGKHPFMMRTSRPIREAEFDNKNQVKDFEDRKIECSQNIKEWDELTIEQRKQLLATLAEFDQEDSEQALALDLLLHTIRAPGYRVEDLCVESEDLKGVYRENRPGRINVSAMGYASQRNSASRPGAFYSERFKNLQRHVNQEMNPQYANQNGWTSLMTAVQKSSFGTKNVQESYLLLVQEMLQKGADVNAVTTKKYLLSENGQDFIISDSPDASTLTPLIVAVRLGNLDAVDILMKNGANVDQKDSSGQAALDYVERKIVAEKDPAVKQRFEFIKMRLNGNESVAIEHGGNSVGSATIVDVASNLEGVSFPVQQPAQTKPDQDDKEEQATDETKKLEGATEALGPKQSLDPQPEDEKPTLEEFFTELRKTEISHDAVKTLLEKGAAEYINETDPIKEGPTSGFTPLAIAVIRGDVQLVQTVITKGADVNKKSNDQTPLQLALQQLEEAKKAKNDAKIKAAEEIVKALKDAGAKEEEKKPEEKVVEVDSLKRAEGESLADWYARVAAYWGDQEAKLRTQIENEQDADKKKALTAQADYHKKLADVYTLIYDKENALANETDPEKRKKLLAELTRLSSSLLEGVPTYYKTYHADALADSKHPLAIQMDNQTSEIQKASNAYQKELLALNQRKVRPGKGGDRPDSGQGGSGQPVSQTPEVNVGTPPTTPVISTGPTGVTPALIDSVAQAKHDGAQEKSWWERNQEWIWWVLGIIVVAVLGYFGFKDGGWFNKEKKKTTTVASNTNENSNTNTNTNEGTGNTNTGTNTGNTNTGNADTNTGTNNDTLASSGRLYSAKEVNDAIAANAQNIINTRG